ncbi:hypothetical protein CDL12_08711 [Handroanthus impetiginosus]|uniref:Uncharacterized protein n=1 Tax=Handroanthus impetiginosus TaxID=429701 RepID=A0A2G9HM58_9LAMI|nr:hypothetical protein CDL12_08711 [Handroanthus impetiginosus]
MERSSLFLSKQSPDQFRATIATLYLLSFLVKPPSKLIFTFDHFY